MKIEVSTPKSDLANKLVEYSFREQKEILKAARCLHKYLLYIEDEADETIEELENEK